VFVKVCYISEFVESRIAMVQNQQTAKR